MENKPKKTIKDKAVLSDKVKIKIIKHKPDDDTKQNKSKRKS